MEPSKTDEDAVVDLLDVVLREGVLLQADVVITVADVPLVGLQLRAALAGMTTMTEYGLLTEFDRAVRDRALENDADPDADRCASTRDDEPHAADESHAADGPHAASEPHSEDEP